VELEIFVKVVDFEENFDSIELERTKVMLTVGIIGGAEIIKGCDGIDEPTDGFCAKRSNAGAARGRSPRST
jgi:hypothetical protein